MIKITVNRFVLCIQFCDNRQTRLGRCRVNGAGDYRPLQWVRELTKYFECCVFVVLLTHGSWLLIVQHIMATTVCGFKKKHQSNKSIG